MSKLKKIVATSFMLSAMASMGVQALETGANFHQSKNYAGAAHFYPESNSTVNLEWTNLNDSFKSVKVGSLSKVLAWKHSTHDQSGQLFKIYEESTPDISEIGGLTMLKVIPKQSEEVLIRLIDTTNSDKKFCLHANVFSPDAQAANVVACSDDERYQVVGYITNTGQKIVSSLQVRNMEQGDAGYGQFINSGNVYYVNNNGNVDIATDENVLVNFPKNMSYKVVGDNRIDFHLTSTAPSFPE